MKLTAEAFRAWENKRITLLGMSGVGKTRLSAMLRRHHWFHYSGDYRIGTRYLDEPILDNLKRQLIGVPFIGELLRSDAIYVRNNISVDRLDPVLAFVGKPGNPARGGLLPAEFKRRQALYRQAEIDAMKDVPAFIRKASEVYGYRHFVNDVGGSLCELDDPEVLHLLDEHTLILYIQVPADHEGEVVHRAEADPKPLYFRPAFLDEQLAVYLREHDLEYVALVDPDDFIRWVFPRLFHARIPRYEAIVREHGYTIPYEDFASVRNETEFLAVVEAALARAERPPAPAQGGAAG